MLIAEILRTTSLFALLTNVAMAPYPAFRAPSPSSLVVALSSSPQPSPVPTAPVAFPVPSFTASLVAPPPVLVALGGQSGQTEPAKASTGAANSIVPQIPALPPLAPAISGALWTDKEREAIRAYWNKPGRYTIGPAVLPATTPNGPNLPGPYQVRLTPEGSTWLLAYQRVVVGPGKIPPTRDAKPTSGPYAEWEDYVATKVAYDRAVAEQTAQRLNALMISPALNAEPLRPADEGRPASGETLRPASGERRPLTLPERFPQAAESVPFGGGVPRLRGGGVSSATQRFDLPPAPGAPPPALLATCGNPPVFASVVKPLGYRVAFDANDGGEFVYTDHVPMRPRYAYYRFSDGIVAYGPRVAQMPQAQKDKLFRAAGFTASEQKAFCAVSAHEGGFETVQTYDTGYISVGFIQFVTMAEGRHDLSAVLLQMKADDPKAFARDFHRFGMDVRPDRTFTVLHPETGAELAGPDAVLATIRDKRLTAVFQRAGRVAPFQIAQIKVARQYYWPADNPLEVPMPDGTTLVGRVRDVVPSEAGLATLLDRKINIGNIRVLPDVVRHVMTRHRVKSFAEARAYERELVTLLKYRGDFLRDTTLAQPPALPVPVVPTPAPVLPTPVPTPVPLPPASPAPPAQPAALPADFAAWFGPLFASVEEAFAAASGTSDTPNP